MFTNKGKGREDKKYKAKASKCAEDKDKVIEDEAQEITQEVEVEVNKNIHNHKRKDGKSN